MTKTRREFLHQATCGTLSASALLAGLGRFALIDALAAPTPGSGSGYRALVCIFLYGGNDSNNTVIPFDDYQLYANVRGGSGIAIPQTNCCPSHRQAPDASLDFTRRYRNCIPFGITKILQCCVTSAR